jgi:uncharacterized membrane protein
MSEAPVQVIIAAFSSPEGAGKVMDELKQGKKAGLIGIVDAAAIVKDANGKLKITDARRRSRRRMGLITGGLVGGLVGLLAGPVALAALGGGAVGALGARLAGTPLRKTMESFGESLTPNSSAIVAVVEHNWVPQLEAALIAEGARVAHEALMADIATQLQAGGNVLYTAGAGDLAAGAARIADGPEGTRVSAVLSDGEGLLIADAEFTDEQLEDAVDDAPATDAEKPADA